MNWVRSIGGHDLTCFAFMFHFLADGRSKRFVIIRHFSRNIDYFTTEFVVKMGEENHTQEHMN